MDVGEIKMVQCEGGDSHSPGNGMDTTEAVLDNGATSFVVGNRTLQKYLGQLKARGYDTETVKIFSCT